MKNDPNHMHASRKTQFFLLLITKGSNYLHGLIINLNYPPGFPITKASVNACWFDYSCPVKYFFILFLEANDLYFQYIDSIAKKMWLSVSVCFYTLLDKLSHGLNEPNLNCLHKCICMHRQYI